MNESLFQIQKDSKLIEKDVMYIFNTYADDFQLFAIELQSSSLSQFELHLRDFIKNILINQFEPEFFLYFDDVNKLGIFYTLTLFFTLERSCLVGCDVSSLIKNIYKEIKPGLIADEKNLIDTANKFFLQGPITNYTATIPHYRHNRSLRGIANKNKHLPLYWDVLEYEKASREFDYFFMNKNNGSNSGAYRWLDEIALCRMRAVDEHFTKEQLLYYQKNYRKIRNTPVGLITSEQYDILMQVLALKYEYLIKYDSSNYPANLLHLQLEWDNFTMIYFEQFPEDIQFWERDDLYDIFSMINTISFALSYGILNSLFHEEQLTDATGKNLYLALSVLLGAAIAPMNADLLIKPYNYPYETFKKYHTLTEQFNPNKFTSNLEEKLINAVSDNCSPLKNLIQLCLLSNYATEYYSSIEQYVQISECFFGFLENASNASVRAESRKEDLHIITLQQKLGDFLDANWRQYFVREKTASQEPYSYTDLICDRIESTYSYPKQTKFFIECNEQRYTIVYRALQATFSSRDVEKSIFHFIKFWIHYLSPVKKAGTEKYYLNNKIGNKKVQKLLCDDIINSLYPNQIAYDEDTQTKEYQARDHILEILSQYGIKFL